MLLQPMEILEIQICVLRDMDPMYSEEKYSNETASIVAEAIRDISESTQVLSHAYWMGVQDWDENMVLRAMADMRSAIRRVKWRF